MIIAPIQTEAEECTARHLRLCRRLAELAMGLAELAAEKAHAQAATEKAATEKAATEKPATEKPAAAEQTAPARPDSSGPRGPDPTFLFIRLASVVRHAIMMESRIVAGRKPRAAGAPERGPQPDLRRAPVQAALNQALANHPDQATLGQETTALMDAFIAEYPDHDLPAAHLFELVCGDLRIDAIWPEPPDG